MLKRLLLTCSWLFALPLFGATVSGHAYYNGAYNNWQYAYATTYVKFCVDDGVHGVYGTGQCYTTTAGPSSNYSPYSIAVADNQYYYFFVWSDSADFGSSTSPAWSAPNGTAIIRVYVPSYGVPYPFEVYADPRPHAPTAVNPSNGATNVNAQSFTLTWSSGIDSLRNWPGTWPITYDIYGHGEGGTDILEVANAPCNPDASGNCTYPITNLVPNTHYYWHVVAKLNTGLLSYNQYYTTSSAQFDFTTWCFDGTYWIC